MTVRSARPLLIFAAVATTFLLPSPVRSQTGKAGDIPRLSNGKPDFNGVSDHPRVFDVTRNVNACAAGAHGCAQEGSGELSFTEWGQAQWKDVTHRFDYSAHCLPWGYARAWQVEYPVEIVQTPQRMAILFESNNIFHVVATVPAVDADPLEGCGDGDVLCEASMAAGIALARWFAREARRVYASLSETAWTAPQMHDALAQRGFLVRECSDFSGLEVGSLLTGTDQLVATQGHIRFGLRSPEENDRLLDALRDLLETEPPAASPRP